MATWSTWKLKYPNVMSLDKRCVCVCVKVDWESHECQTRSTHTPVIFFPCGAIDGLYRVGAHFGSSRANTSQSTEDRQFYGTKSIRPVKNVSRKSSITLLDWRRSFSFPHLHTLELSRMNTAIYSKMWSIDWIQIHFVQESIFVSFPVNALGWMQIRDAKWEYENICDPKCLKSFADWRQKAAKSALSIGIVQAECLFTTRFVCFDLETPVCATLLEGEGVAPDRNRSNWRH